MTSSSHFTPLQWPPPTSKVVLQTQGLLQSRDRQRSVRHSHLATTESFKLRDANRMGKEAPLCAEGKGRYTPQKFYNLLTT
jgi:hypothetical protein